MLRGNDCIKEYKNGNITIKYDPVTVAESLKDDILVLSEVLSRLDCYIIGDEFCISNYETGCSIYNYFSDKWYIFPFSYIYKLERGEAVKLYAYDPFNGFKVKGKTYSEKKANAKMLAIDFQSYFSQYEFGYSELAYYQSIFEKIGRKYGLLKEFRENGIL